MRIEVDSKKCIISIEKNDTPDSYSRASDIIDTLGSNFTIKIH